MLWPCHRVLDMFAAVYLVCQYIVASVARAAPPSTSVLGPVLRARRHYARPAPRTTSSWAETVSACAR